MENIKLTIAYEGTRYAGWQSQNTPGLNSSTRQKPTIQQALERALTRILQKRIQVISSGRTDAGVHSVAQVVHFKTSSHLDCDRLKRSLNGVLPRDIVISSVEKVNSDFHARFNAKSKTYRYLILNQSNRDSFLGKWTYWVRFPLDVKLMQKEAQCLVGRHDFRSFQASDRIPRTSIRTIKKLQVKKLRRGSFLPFVKNAQLLAIDIEADGFLFNMVRNIAGTLVDVGRGRFKEGDLRAILKKKSRKFAGPCLSPQGLFLMQVNY